MGFRSKQFMSLGLLGFRECFSLLGHLTMIYRAVGASGCIGLQLCSGLRVRASNSVNLWLWFRVTGLGFRGLS